MAMQGRLSNQRLGNKYLLGELVGYGGFGEVYKAQNVLLNRPQAIKVILEKHLSEPKFRGRFIREAQTLAGLNHPNILHVDDFEIEQARAYLVMPFISGGTLHSILVQAGPLSPTVAEHYLKQICAALDYAHTRNVVHLDLKPRNLLHQDGTLLLSDFGLAHLMKEGAVEGGTSLRFGSPHYMAPEQISGQPQACSDIYALGVMLYQMLAGHPPFEGSAPETIMMKHLNEPPPLLSTVRPDLPPALGVVIARALAKKPEERYATAGALLGDFNAAISATTKIPDQPEKKEIPLPASRPWYKLSSRDIFAGLSSLVLGLIVSIVSGSLAKSSYNDLPIAFAVLGLPYLMGITVAILSGRKGFSALWPTSLGNLGGGFALLITFNAILGSPPPDQIWTETLIIVSIYVFLSLLGATTYVGIRKRFRRKKPEQAKAPSNPVRIP